MGRDSGRSVHLLPLLISTHAPLWGATVGVNHCRLAAVFQPTRPYGARQASRRGERSGRDFNPRAPMGRDCAAVAIPRSRSNFNPRAPMGRDTKEGEKQWPTCHFNPRAPMGRDSSGLFPHVAEVISTHAPLWGATDLRRHAHGRLRISTHAPLWGATGSLCRIVHFSLIVFIFQDA